MTNKDESGIIRVEHDSDHPYKVINTGFATDQRLSWAARGVLVYLLSKPDGWKLVTKDLIQQSPSGRDAVYAVLKNLEQCGYLRRVRNRRQDGTFEYTTVIYEKAQTTSAPLPAFPYTVQPETVQPYTDNPEIYRVRRVVSKDKVIKESSGGGSDTEAAAAVGDQTLTRRLITDLMLMPDQAAAAALLPGMTAETVDRLVAWRQMLVDRNLDLPQQKQKKPQAILAWYIKQGRLPDDLPPPVQPELTEDQKMQRYLDSFNSRTVHPADYRR